jgi:hypothetical protein
MAARPKDKLTKCDNPAIEDGGLLQPVSAPHLTALTRFLELFKPDCEFVGDPIIRVRVVLEPGNLFESPIVPGGAYCPGLRLAMRGMSDLKRWKRVLHVVLTTHPCEPLRLALIKDAVRPRAEVAPRTAERAGLREPSGKRRKACKRALAVGRGRARLRSAGGRVALPRRGTGRAGACGPAVIAHAIRNGRNNGENGNRSDDPAGIVDGLALVSWRVSSRLHIDHE